MPVEKECQGSLSIAIAFLNLPNGRTDEPRERPDLTVFDEIVPSMRILALAKRGVTDLTKCQRFLIFTNVLYDSTLVPSTEAILLSDFFFNSLSSFRNFGVKLAMPMNYILYLLTRSETVLYFSHKTFLKCDIIGEKCLKQ